MFNKLHLKGFKSFLDENIELKPLTLLTGLNSSGKSSVIQAIRMIRNFRKNRTAIISGYGGLDELHNIFCRSELLIDLDGYQITSEYGSNDYNTNDGYDVEGDSFSTYWSCPLDSITYIGADRLGAKTNMPLQYGESTRGENVLFTLDWFSNGNLVLDERLKPENAEGLTLDYVVNGWLKCISPNVKFEYKVDRKADISYSRFNGFRATNVGFGLSYTLPIIVALLVSTTQKDSVVLIENPEAHLHPKGQTEMAKLIAKCVECGAQVIAETHSDHLFDGVRIYTKHNPQFSEKVVTHWFELDDNNNTKVESIIITPEGRIADECPKGFFDQFEINAEELLF